jgi:hypothetical protein
MPITVEKLPDEPIIILTITKPVDFAQELPPAYDEVAELLQEIEGPFYRISDFSGMQQSGVNELINLLMTAFRSRSGSLIDPELKARTRSLIVGDFKLVEMGVSILRKQAPDLNVSVFRSVNTALAYARDQLEEAAA